jgi:hypothetical protein
VMVRSQVFAIGWQENKKPKDDTRQYITTLANIPYTIILKRLCGDNRK